MTRRKYADRKTAGLCPTCGRTGPSGARVLCRACGAKRRAVTQRIYRRRVADGLCPTCTGDVEKGEHVLCPECRAALRITTRSAVTSSPRRESTGHSESKPSQ